jgi:Arc/MetJ family transcription regulator
MRENAMKSTITLDGKLVEEVMKVTPAKTKTRAVTIALAEHVRRKKLERLRSMLGKVEMDEGALEKLRNLEMEIRETGEGNG